MCVFSLAENVEGVFDHIGMIFLLSFFLKVVLSGERHYFFGHHDGCDLGPVDLSGLFEYKIASLEAVVNGENVFGGLFDGPE